MANLRNSKKAIRQIKRRTAINKSRRTNMRTHIRRVEEAIAIGDADAARAAFQAAQPKIIRAAQKGILHKNTASRKVSRLARRVNTMTPATNRP